MNPTSTGQSASHKPLAYARIAPLKRRHGSFRAAMVLLVVVLAAIVGLNILNSDSKSDAVMRLQLAGLIVVPLGAGIIAFLAIRARNAHRERVWPTIVVIGITLLLWSQWLTCYVWAARDVDAIRSGRMPLSVAP